MLSVECETGENMTDSGVDSELSPSSPDSVIELPGLPQTAPAPGLATSGCTAEELVARLEAETEDTMETDKMETVAALLSLSHSEASHSPASSNLRHAPKHTGSNSNRKPCSPHMTPTTRQVSLSRTMNSHAERRGP